LSGLQRLGLQPDIVYEAIVTTYTADREPHAAAMGVQLDSSSRLVLRPFKTSQTYHNIALHRQAVVNLTSDPEHFYNAVFSLGLLYREAVVVNAPALADAWGWIEVRAEEFQPIGHVREAVYCKVLHVEEGRTNPAPYTRAAHALIESLIHYTRIKVFANTENHQEAVRLAELVSHYSKLVERVAPRTRYAEMMDHVVKEVERLVGKHEG
jgi:uncharacterized protein